MGQKKDELFRRIREEEALRSQIQPPDVYNPSSMRSRMPVGCLLWILLGLVGAGYALFRLFLS